MRDEPLKIASVEALTGTTASIRYAAVPTQTSLTADALRSLEEHVYGPACDDCTGCERCACDGLFEALYCACANGDLPPPGRRATAEEFAALERAVFAEACGDGSAPGPGRDAAGQLAPPTRLGSPAAARAAEALAQLEAALAKPTVVALRGLDRPADGGPDVPLEPPWGPWVRRPGGSSQPARPPCVPCLGPAAKLTKRVTLGPPPPVTVDDGAAPDLPGERVECTSEATFVPLNASAPASAPKWLGADGGRSIDLRNGTHVHLFGDTAVYPVPSNLWNYAFIGNSIGIGRCLTPAGGKPRYAIEYRYPVVPPPPPEDMPDPTNGARPFFETPGSDGSQENLEGANPRLWPMDGCYLRGRLHVLLQRTRLCTPAENTKNVPFCWRMLDYFIASVANPLDDPREWRTTYSWLALGEANAGAKAAGPDLSMVAHRDLAGVPDDRFVYLFGMLRHGFRPSLHRILGPAIPYLKLVGNMAVLFRLPSSALDRGGSSAPPGLQSSLQFLSPDGTWKPYAALPSATALSKLDAVALGALAVSGGRATIDLPAYRRGLEQVSGVKVVAIVGTSFYPEWHPSLRRWLVVRDPWLAGQIVLQAATHLDGPWQDPPALVYAFPERKLGFNCYAVTEQPAFRRAGWLVATYACNTTTGLIPEPEDIDGYLPKTILIDLAKLPEPLLHSSLPDIGVTWTGP